MNVKAAYSSAVLLIFLRNPGKNLDSINQVIRFTDMQMKTLGIQNNLSESTKYMIIKELLASGILYSTTRKEHKKQAIYLSKKVSQYFNKEKENGKEKTNSYIPTLL